MTAAEYALSLVYWENTSTTSHFNNLKHPYAQVPTLEIRIHMRACVYTHSQSYTLLHTVALDISLQDSCSGGSTDDRIREEGSRVELQLDVTGTTVHCGAKSEWEKHFTTVNLNTK